MKIAVISDTHDNIANVDNVLAFLKREKITTLIHCGDTSTFETIEYIRNNFDGDIYATLGNDEKNPDERVAQTGNFKEFTQFFSIGDLRIGDSCVAFIHYPDAAKNLARSGKYDAVFYGHTHKPWMEKIGNCMLLNPGNVAGVYYPASFAIIDTDTLHAQLVRIDAL